MIKKDNDKAHEEIEASMRAFATSPPFPIDASVLQALQEHPAYGIVAPQLSELARDWLLLVTRALTLYSILGVPIDLAPKDLPAFFEKLKEE